MKTATRKPNRNPLTKPSLVLNKSWQPVNVIPSFKSICLVFSDRAKVIDPALDFQQFTWEDWTGLTPSDGEDVVRAGPGLRYRIPEIILLQEYNKLYSHKVNFSRRELFKRDNYQCQYCGKRPDPSELSVDHIYPKSLGGLTTWENCVLACVKCNARKADKSLKQANMKLRKTPKKPPHRFYRGDYKFVPKSWKDLLGEAYWEVELINDN